MDFDAFDQTQHDPALRFKINRVQFFGDGAREFLEPIDDQEQLALYGPLLPRLHDLLINRMRSLIHACQSGSVKL